MKLPIFITINFIIIGAALSLPTPEAAATTHSPIRIAVKQYMKTYLKQSEEIVLNALKTVPETVDLKESRDILKEFLQHIELYKTKYENCDWNLLNFNKDLRTVLNYFGNDNASVDNKNIMDFLVTNGLKNVKDQCHIYVRQFLNGELGDEKDINGEFC